MQSSEPRARFGAGEEMALLVELIEKPVCGFSIVLRNEGPDVGEIHFGEF